MFATRADNLIGQLVGSYNETQALDYAAQALRSSFANAFSGYDTSGIIGSLNTIKDAANEAAAAVANANNAGNSTTVEVKKEWKGHWFSPNAYATGLKKSDMDQLAWTQEVGAESILSPTRNAILTPIRKHDSVLNADMTDNLWKWAEQNPNEFIKSMQLGTPQLPLAVGAETNNSMTVGSLIQVNGPVNDSLEMMKIAANQAARVVTQSFKKMNDGIHK